MPTIMVEQAMRLPVEQRGPALLGLKEDQWFDRKSSRVGARDLGTTEVGFANAEGGVVAIGLSNGRVEGIDARRDRLNDWQQAALDFTVPPVRAHCHLLPCANSDGEADHLLIVEVGASETVHANSHDEVYLRVGDENRRLNYRQRQELIYDKGQSTFESTRVPDAALDELDQPLLRSYADAVGHPEPTRLLVARGLAGADGRITVAGVLLFGREPQARYPEAIVRVLRYRGSERGAGARQQLVDDVRCEGPIPNLLQEARSAVYERVPTRQALGADGRFQAVGLVPEDAWLEGLVNAVVHRSYSLIGDLFASRSSTTGWRSRARAAFLASSTPPTRSPSPGLHATLESLAFAPI